MVEPKDFKGYLQGLPKAYQPYSCVFKDAENLQLGEAEEEESPPSNHESPSCGHPEKTTPSRRWKICQFNGYHPQQKHS